MSSAPELPPTRPRRARLRPLWRWSERALVALVALGTGLAFGLRDALVPWTSLVFYATPLPLLSLGALTGVALAARRSRRRASAWGLLAFVLIAATLQSETFRASPPAATAESLRVVTWNLQGCQAGLEPVLNALTELDGDLLCLSEIGHYEDRERSFLRGLEAQLRARGYLLRSWPGARLIVALRASEGELHKQTFDRAAGVARILWTEARWRGRPLRLALADFRSTPTLDRRPGTDGLLANLEAALALRGRLQHPAHIALLRPLARGRRGPGLRGGWSWLRPDLAGSLARVDPRPRLVPRSRPAQRLGPDPAGVGSLSPHRDPGLA